MIAFCFRSRRTIGALGGEYPMIMTSGVSGDEGDSCTCAVGKGLGNS